jgi:muconolactone delta-isomerase
VLISKLLKTFFELKLFKNPSPGRPSKLHLCISFTFVLKFFYNQREEIAMTKKALLVLVLIGGFLSLIWLANSQPNPSPTPSMPPKEAVSAKLATLERGWVKNEGQWDEEALFSAPGYFGHTWVTKDGELLHVAVKKEECKEKACPSKSWVISERWVGGKVQAIKGEEELQTKVSYFVDDDPSKHKSGLSTYRYVSLGKVWSGVEVKLKATQKTVEKLFYVQPGADPSKIVVEVNGAKGLKLSKDGEIIIQTGLGELKLSKPVAWQEKDGKKLPVEVSYKLIGKNRYSFVVAKADPSLPIVIDPILQSTYLGGSDDDKVNAIAIHPQTGEVYVAGATFSDNFPKTTGGVQKRCNNCVNDPENPSGDVFVARLNKDLTQILQSTYLGGSSDDYADALAIHPKTGEVYVVGVTESKNFPKTTGGAQVAHGGGDVDSFVARLNKDLTQILQSTYLGGSGRDWVNALAIHPTTGEVYVAGRTESKNFPKTTGGAQGSFGGGNRDAFVARLNKDLTRILQAIYLGGINDDEAYTLAIHSNTGEVYVAGVTESKNFPKTTGGAQAVYGGGYYDAFVARLNKDLTQILQSTYLGGSDVDKAIALTIHPTTGEIYVAGYTTSTNFPGTTGGAQVAHGGGDVDSFVARLNKDLTQILQSTYLGGSGSDYAAALAIHPTTGEVYVVGVTESKNFPKTTGGVQAAHRGGDKDSFVARLNKDLTQILQSTYLGGSDVDKARALAIHPTTGEVYVAGYTLSSNFPKTAGGAQTKCNNCFTSRSYDSGDAFVARLSADLAAGRSSGNGSSMIVSASSTVSFWRILLVLSVPTFALARRIRKR